MTGDEILLRILLRLFIGSSRWEPAFPCL